MLVLSGAEVRALLDLDELVEALRAAMIDVSAGRVSAPPRVAALVPEQDAMLLAMPAYLPSAGALASKLISLFPGNRDQPTHQALICCFDPATGTPAAVMDGGYLTAARTAGGSALATRLLARPDARDVAVVGTGVQAEAHARALARLPGVRTVRIAGRDPARAAALARSLDGLGLPVEAAASIEDAVRAAGVVCATTHAASPVLRRDWLRPGTHVNSVGYNPSGDGELDTATIRDALVVVESRAAALAPPPAGAVELHRAIEQGAIERGAIERGAIEGGHVAVEIGQIAAGTAAGRTGGSQLTVYKSVGVAAQDAAAAALVLTAARRQGAGTIVSL